MDAREGLSPPWSRVATECLDSQPPGGDPLTITARAEAERLERPRARTPTVLRTRLLIQPDRFPDKPRRHDSNVRPPPSEGGALILLSYGELVCLLGRQVKLPSVDGRGRTCTLRFRRPAPSPLGHVDTKSVSIDSSFTDCCAPWRD